MARVVKPEGKVLLLQHGRGYYDFINNRLDRDASRHHSKWGCWWNRPIMGLVKEVRVLLSYQMSFHQPRVESSDCVFCCAMLICNTMFLLLLL